MQSPSFMRYFANIAQRYVSSSIAIAVALIVSPIHNAKAEPVGLGVTYSAIGPRDNAGGLFSESGSTRIGPGGQFSYSASGVGYVHGTPTANWAVSMEASVDGFGTIRYRNYGFMSEGAFGDTGSELRLSYSDSIELLLNGQSTALLPDFLRIGYKYQGSVNATYTGTNAPHTSRTTIDSTLSIGTNVIYHSTFQNPFEIGPKYIPIDVRPVIDIPVSGSTDKAAFLLNFSAFTGAATSSGNYDGNFGNSITLDYVRLPDGRTPEEAGFEVRFASGIVSPNITSVPEPSSLCLVALAGTAIVVRWRSRSPKAATETTEQG